MSPKCTREGREENGREKEERKPRESVFYSVLRVRRRMQAVALVLNYTSARRSCANVSVAAYICVDPL